MGNAVAGVRNWVYDLFGRHLARPDRPDPLPFGARRPPPSQEQPEITRSARWCRWRTPRPYRPPYDTRP